jgi:predicted  nucleic acid-binding Zn-ribbon protein
MSSVFLYGVFAVLLLMAAGLVQCLRVITQLQGAHIKAESELRALRNDITAVGRGAIGVGKRVQTLQQRIQTTERRQEDLEYKDMGKVAFSHATKLVQLGAAAGELVSTCGLSQAEADLVALMHVRSKDTRRNAA